MKGSSLTLFSESYSDVWINIIREIFLSNIYDVYLPIITSLIIHYCKDRKNFVQKQNGESRERCLEDETCFIIDLTTLS